MNEREFGILLEENQNRIYRLALRILENQEEARDVTQETLLAAFEHRARFRGEAKFSTYLYRITLNFALATLKKKRRHLALEKVERLISGSENPAQEFHKEERMEKVREVLSSLPERQKAVIHLRIYEDMSFSEIAAALGCRPATARTHYFFGLQNLRKELKRHHGLP